MNFLHTSNTGALRKTAKIPYPLTYAPSTNTTPEAHRFNCAQRSHANFIENQPTALAGMLIAGLRFPIAASVLGAGWTVCRWLYMRGYSKGEATGRGRYNGIAFWAFQAGLLGLSGWTGVAMVMGW
jgi:glutathione S-transferase